jgi:hypothetical protein
MNAGKPRKSAPRKASKPTLEQRVATIEAAREFDGEWLEEINKRIDALESRERLRDKSHDEPVSNANEVIGLYPPTTPVRHEWKRRSPEEAHQRKWWQFWRRT